MKHQRQQQLHHQIADLVAFGPISFQLALKPRELFPVAEKKRIFIQEPLQGAFVVLQPLGALRCTDSQYKRGRSSGGCEAVEGFLTWSM